MLQNKNNPKYKYSGKENDFFFPPKYRYVNNNKICKICCNILKKVKRTRFYLNIANFIFIVHFGIIKLGNNVIKFNENRSVFATLNRLINFEIKGSGI